jgi:hypothetical protein
VDSPEHLSALVVGKLCRHYAPLPLVPPPIVRLPDRTATCPYAPLPRRPLSYAMSCIFIPPSASRRTLNGSAVVAIGACRGDLSPYAKTPPILSDASRWKSTLTLPLVSRARNLGSECV